MVPHHLRQAVQGGLQVEGRNDFAHGRQAPAGPEPVDEPAAEFVGIEDAVQIGAPDGPVPAM